ncbi:MULTISPECIES: hypothetical protein [Thiomicrorhabdus]|uniref:Response regulatory domain-containing protein n=1 Tax=Thiomicrorhabdus heinhorstiae TaxID=2748010 RepID=A0ABS0BUU5_9GAMM|nr:MULTISPECIES: hypothetical protein [Thiomicrorhabdus]MBF6057574.1 hypothetical protein [Thiomicrorhabdus heinhorstiae]
MKAGLTEKLIWLKGKKVAVFDPDESRVAVLKRCFDHYGVDMLWIDNYQAVSALLEARRYSTHRIFLTVFLYAGWVEAFNETWSVMTQKNPHLLQTPLLLVGTDEEKHALSESIDLSMFKEILPEPVTPRALMRTLMRSSPWEVAAGDIPMATLQRGSSHRLKS